MTTINLFVSGDVWFKAVEASQENFLVSWNNVKPLEFAVTDNDSAPEGIVGHVLQSGDALTRQTIGAGTLWVRNQGQEDGEVIVLVVS